MYATVKELREPLRAALAAVGYGARDVQVVAAERLEMTVGGGAGMRGFVTVVNLDTGERKTVNGSWGGSSVFTSSPVDAGGGPVELPENAAVVKGTRGHPRTFATIYAHPRAVSGYLLPSASPPADMVSDQDQQALYCFYAIKGGAYRKDELRRREVSEATIGSLIARGYLKRSANGATQITTMGKNARDMRIQ
jgi:hypothetical protein